VKNAGDTSQAPEGNVNACAALKCVIPDRMIQSVVPTTPIQSSAAILPITVMRRYSSSTANAATPIARNVPFVMVNSMVVAPMPGRGIGIFVEVIVSINAGQRYAAYCAKPMQPEAIESGALKVSCQTNRKESQRPARPGYIARR
jgi:hypothetical protein